MTDEKTDLYALCNSSSFLNTVAWSRDNRISVTTNETIYVLVRPVLFRLARMW